MVFICAFGKPILRHEGTRCLQTFHRWRAENLAQDLVKLDVEFT